MLSSFAEQNELPPNLSIIVPCYNESRNIIPFIAEIKDIFEKNSLDLRWEIIFVDDNSPDKTIEIIRNEAQKDRRIRGIRRVGRRGLSSAVIEGMMSASSDLVAVMDGDLQHDPASLPIMLKKLLEGGADLVVASRYREGGSPSGLANKWRHFLSRSAIMMVQKILSISLTDPMSGFFLLKREIVENSVERLRGEGFKILLDIIMNAPSAIKISEVPTCFRARSFGESKLNYKVIICFLTFIVVSLGKKKACCKNSSLNDKKEND